MLIRALIVCLLSSAAVLSAEERKPFITDDEQLLRFAYTKLHWYLMRQTLAEAEAASRGVKLTSAGAPATTTAAEPGRRAVPRVSLGRISFGPLDAIRDRPAMDFVTRPEGKVPQIPEAIYRGLSGKESEHASFSVSWSDSYNDSNIPWGAGLTVDGLIRAALVGKGFERYAAYEVRVSDLERHGVYKGLALFGPVLPNGRLRFVDLNFVTGSAAQLALYEERPMLPIHYFINQKTARAAGEFGLASNASDGPGDTPICGAASSAWPCDGGVCCLSNPASPTVACCWRPVAH